MSRNNILEVYTGSISGGGFPAQVQQILYITEQKKKAFSTETDNIYTYYTPDLCMGTSGGNIALYIAISGNWDEGGIKRVINSMSPSMFSQTWWPEPMGFLPTWILGIFEGAVYRPGYGANNLLDAYNNPSNITSVEMWNTAYNKDQKKTGLFCNKKDGQTFVSSLTYSPYNFKTLSLNYLNGNISKISSTVVASASVPLLFKPVEIDGEEYEDGGVTYASPLTPLQEEIYKCIKGITLPLDYETTLSSPPIPVGTTEQYDTLTVKRSRSILHLTYLSPYNADSTEDTDSSLGSGNVFSTITDASAVKDKYVGINLLERVMNPGQNIKVIDSRNGLYEMSDLLRTYNSAHYFCYIYVRNNEWIDMNKFTPKDILNKMEEAKSQIEYLFFYIE